MIGGVEMEVALLKRDVTELKREQDEIKDSLLRIEKSLSKYQGMAGMALIIVTLLVAAGKFIYETFSRS